MLFTAATLDGLADGSVTTTYRRWTTVRPKVGSRFTTRAGMVEVTGITAVDADGAGRRRRCGCRFRGSVRAAALAGALGARSAGHASLGGGRAVPDRPRRGRTRSPSRPAGRRRSRRGRPHRSRPSARPDGCGRRRTLDPGGAPTDRRATGRGVDRAGRGGRSRAPRLQAPGAASEGARPDREPGGRLPAVATRSWRSWPPTGTDARPDRPAVGRLSAPAWPRPRPAGAATREGEIVWARSATPRRMPMSAGELCHRPRRARRPPRHARRRQGRAARERR